MTVHPRRVNKSLLTSLLPTASEVTKYLPGTQALLPEKRKGLESTLLSTLESITVAMSVFGKRDLEKNPQAEQHLMNV